MITLRFGWIVPERWSRLASATTASERSQAAGLFTIMMVSLLDSPEVYRDPATTA
jgi:hypothetical protein